MSGVKWNKPRPLPVPPPPTSTPVIAPKAKAALADIRRKAPPAFKATPPTQQWASEYDRREEAVEREEAESLLQQRRERLAALKEETLALQTNRKIALSFGRTGLHLLSSMQKAAEALDRKLSDNPGDLKIATLREIIHTTGSTVSRAQSAIESMAKVERYIARHPISNDDEDADDLAGLNAEGAKLILSNIAKALQHMTPPAVVADVAAEPAAEAPAAEETSA